jgi:hypothetical protein
MRFADCSRRHSRVNGLLPIRRRPLPISMIRASRSWSFPREEGDDLGEPWTRGYPPVWRGTVAIRHDGLILEVVPGVCVAARAYLPWPDSPTRRIVPDWKHGLFRLVSASSPDPQYGLTEFEVAWEEFGFSACD